MKPSSRPQVLSGPEAPLPAGQSPTGFPSERRLEPELLDTLPADDREAQRSRRDLRLINAAMRNAGWFRRTLARRLCAGDRVLELGPGDSRLREIAPRGVVWDGIDRAPRPAAWPPEGCWHQEDIVTFADWSAYTVVVANLVLHHFTAAELHILGVRIAQHARLVVACEPARRRALQPLLALFCQLIRASPVTRHDGRVSIAAGFLGHELPEALGLLAPHWETQARVAGLGAYRLIAERCP